ncbi:MAG TPA: 3-phosphoshikimate 1-carboxyvinyltransferase [Brumimicrobium sp.]|nr:3-phosphoshikimate 1-carboxyvinyltransferase [Brumimicrobium sp.]
MNEILLHPKKDVLGHILLPSSKSYAQRALALAGLSQEKVVIHRLVESDDCIAAQNIIQALGAEFTRENDSLLLHKGIDFKTSEELEINCGESGLSTRLFSAFSLLFDQSFTLNGEGSIAQRTMEMVIEGLEQFGKKIKSNQSKLPLVISGKVNQHQVEIDGSISSQFLTGLITVAPFLNFDTEITVRNLKSKPYISMTIDLLNHFGLTCENKKFEKFYIQGNQKVSEEIEYSVEGDWSAASFMIVAGAIGGRMKLEGLKMNTHQGDVAILEAVKQAGARVKWENDRLIIEKDKLQAIHFDATECPDLFPPLVVLAAYVNGKSTFKGVHRLKHKESDRAITLQQECKKVGVIIEIIGDEMIVHGRGGGKVNEPIVFSSHNDHRIAMAMSLFSIGAHSPIKITGAKAIDKSYPDFYKDFLTV